MGYARIDRVQSGPNACGRANPTYELGAYPARNPTPNIPAQMLGYAPLTCSIFPNRICQADGRPRNAFDHSASGVAARHITPAGYFGSSIAGSLGAGRNLSARRSLCSRHHTRMMEHHMGRGLLLWLIGIPLPIILLIWLFGGLH